MTEAINLLVAVLLYAPLSVIVTQAIKRASWSSGAKAVVALACAIAVGVAGTWVSGDLLGLMDEWGSLTSEQVIAYLGIVYASATVWYNTNFGDTDFMKRLAEWPK